MKRETLTTRIHNSLLSPLMLPVPVQVLDDATEKIFISIHSLLIQSDLLSNIVMATCTLHLHVHDESALHPTPEASLPALVSYSHFPLTRILLYRNNRPCCPPPCTIQHDAPLCIKDAIAGIIITIENLCLVGSSQPPPPACPFRMMPLRDFIGTDPAPDRLPAAK